MFGEGEVGQRNRKSFKEQNHRDKVRAALIKSLCPADQSLGSRPFLTWLLSNLRGFLFNTCMSSITLTSVMYLDLCYYLTWYFLSTNFTLVLIFLAIQHSPHSKHFFPPPDLEIMFLFF